MSSCYARVSAAFERWSERIAMFFTIRAPSRGQLLEDPVIGKTGIHVVNVYRDGRNDDERLTKLVETSRW